jgi:hypothetical protein
MLTLNLVFSTGAKESKLYIYMFTMLHEQITGVWKTKKEDVSQVRGHRCNRE